MANIKEKKADNYFNSPIGHIRDRIIIHPSSDIPKEGLFISLNGFAFQVKPGVEIDIPRPVRLMLDTRIKTETRQDEKTNQRDVRDVPRFTYTLIKEGVNVKPETSEIPTEQPAA
jgi:hypothetical protein